jgi:teichuronic acid exporter
VSLRFQVLNGLKWAVIGRVSTQVATWAVTLYVVRILQPEDYGLMALATIFSALFTLVSEIGVGASLVQAQGLTAQRIRQTFGMVILSNALAGAAMSLAVAPLAALFFAEPRLQPVIQVISLQFIPAAFAVVPCALLERELKFRGRAAAEFSAGIGGALTTLLLAKGGYGVYALAWGGVAQAAIRSIGLNLAGDSHGWPSFRFSGSGTLFNFGRNFAATQLVWFFYSQADSFVVGKILGKHALGIYAVAMDLASMPASRLSAILNQVLYPSLSKVRRQGGEVAPYLIRAASVVSLGTFPVMWGISSVAPELVRTLFGEKWVDSALPLSLLCLIMPLRVLSPLLHSGLNAVGRADISFRVTLLTACIMCVGFVAGTPFGLLGLCVAWAVLFPATFVIAIALSQRHLHLQPRQIGIALWRPASVAALMYLAVALIRPLLHWSPSINLLVLVTLGAGSYAVLTLIINRQGLGEARRVVMRGAPDTDPLAVGTVAEPLPDRSI